MNEIEQLNQRVRLLEGVIQTFIKSDRYTMQKAIQMFDGRNIQLGLTTGTIIGTAGGTTGQKLGLWGTTPVVQPAAIADVAAGAAASDGVARTAINAILAALRLPGFIDT